MDGVKSNSIQVQGTNDSSIVSKLSMATCNYIDDQYLKYFVKKPQKRSALINRGYYLRCKAIEHVLELFLSSNLECNVRQVVSLGAGFDTRYFWARKYAKKLNKELVYVEIDFPEVMKRKISLGTEFGLYQNNFSNEQRQNIIFRTENYAAIGHDLRNMGPQLHAALSEVGVNFSQPTLFISEVVLAYLTGSQSSKVISWINHNFSNAFLCIFEQILPQDGFGQVMRRHFEKLGSPLLSICAFPTKESHTLRHKSAGFKVLSSVNLHTFYTNCISQTERTRIENLEMFDEFEGWHQMCLHYIILFSTNSKSSEMAEVCQNAFAMTEYKLMLPKMTGIDPDLTQIIESSKSMEPLQLHGHCMASCTIAQQSYEIIAGGYGIPINQTTKRSAPHSRLPYLVVIDPINPVPHTCKPTTDKLSFPLHASLVTYQTTTNEQALLMFGGRTSPVSCTNSIRSISIIKQDGQFIFSQYNIEPKSSSLPESRWRHSSCMLQNKMVVIGGRNGSKVFGDIWCFDLLSFTWELSNMEPGSFKPRHSHSIVPWVSGSSEKVIISGGLGENMKPLNDVMVLEISDEAPPLISSLGIQPALVARYSHTSHIVGGKTLLLVGGVELAGDGTCNTVCVVHLPTRTWTRTISLSSMYNNCPLRVVDHTSVLSLKEKECRLFIFGGGSNCFSFGTSFNFTPLTVRFAL